MEGSMRALGLQGLRRIPFLRWRSRNSSTGSAVTLVSVKRRLPFCRHDGSSFLLQLFWKFRTQWKQAFGWQRSSAQCSYDLYSYSLNFDDGLCHESWATPTVCFWIKPPLQQYVTSWLAVASEAFWGIWTRFLLSYWGYDSFCDDFCHCFTHATCLLEPVSGQIVESSWVEPCFFILPPR